MTLNPLQQMLADAEAGNDVTVLVVRAMITRLSANEPDRHAYIAQIDL